MTELEIVNHIFALVGLPPVNDTQTANKNVALVTASLDRAKGRVIRQAWRKFANKTTLEVDGSGKIAVTGYLRVIYPQSLQYKLTERNGYVWDIEEDDYYATDIEDAWVISDLSVANIDSESWQELIAYEAAAEFAMTLNDVDQNYAEIVRLRNKARKQAYNEARVNVDGTFDINRAFRGFYS